MKTRRITLPDDFNLWSWYDDQPAKLVYIHLLTKVELKDAYIPNVDLKAGQSVYTVSGLARDLGLTRDQVRTALQHLTETGDIKLITSGAYTIATIRDWDKYVKEV